MKNRQAKQITLRHRKKQKESPIMGRQKHNSQLKGKEESPEIVLNEIKARKLSDLEFKIMVITMLKELSEN